MSGYIGSKAAVVSSGAERKKTYSITGTTTSLTGLSYTVNQVHVFHNGVRLVDGTDFTATNGSSITLTSAAESGDEVVVISYATFQAADAYTKAEADAEFVNDPNSVISVSGSNVGIGTSSPTEDLHVSGTADQTIAVESTSTGNGANAGIKILSADGGDFLWQTGNVTGNALRLYDLNASAERMRIDSSGNVGINDASPSSTLDITNTSTSNNWLNASQSARFYQSSSTNPASIKFTSADNSNGGQITWGGVAGDGPFMFKNYNSERMRIDSSGNLLVGTTTLSDTTAGISLEANGRFKAIRASNSGYFGRLSTDGAIINFAKDGSTVGSIGSLNGDVYIGTGNTTLLFKDGNNAIYPRDANGALRDGAVDWGGASNRFDDIYATNGTIQTSDRNEKQDIDVLSDAEKRVAVACKGLLRKFRWIDAVAEKGDDARIHFGIIAQDLQDAFAAEGLDAGRYAMFISSTWWEANETYTDDDGVEQTRTDTYETLEEAPEGATERTRLGVRYPELLAFIIGAM